MAVYDEENEIWIKVPITSIDYKNNSVTVESNHFSVWGLGLGESMPQNGVVAALLISRTRRYSQALPATRFPFRCHRAELVCLLR